MQGRNDSAIDARDISTLLPAKASRRDSLSRFAQGLQPTLEAMCLSAGALVVALLLFGLFAALGGRDPLAIYSALYVGAFASRFSLENTLTQAAPIMLTALCTALPARVGLLIIGGEGALVLGGLFAVLAATAVSGASAWTGTLVALAGGTLAGALWIAAVGVMKHGRGVNETISSLLLNYIAIALFNHLISGPVRDFSQTLKAQSWSVPETFRIGTLPGWSVHWGLLIGVCVCVLLFVVVRHTTFGFSMDVLGGNRRAAQSAGLPIGRLLLLACLIGGGAAGLAGALEVLAVHGAASESLIVGFGYTGILVAFLARQNPLAIIPVAILVGGISASGGVLQRRFDMPSATTLVLQGLIFICVLASNALAGRVRWFRKA
jgi:general nucleoside transport system permease protein